MIEPKVRIPQDARVTQSFTATLNGKPLVKAQALAGWSLSVHHIYDPIDKVLYLGTGQVLGDPLVQGQLIIDTVAGNGSSSSSSSDRGLATGVGIPAPWSVLALTDGSLYIGGSGVRKVDPQGVIVADMSLFAASANGLALGP